MPPVCENALWVLFMESFFFYFYEWCFVLGILEIKMKLFACGSGSVQFPVFGFLQYLISAVISFSVESGK